uniref:TIR domain-containing protein n=1 Tax=Panagrellus redivivus TaxID=6233 RepID=A0A7E5A1C4_PANRE
MRWCLLLLGIGLAVAYDCPKDGRLPPSCVCDESEHGMLVRCHNSSIMPILKVLNGKTVDILRIENCTDSFSTPEELPVVFVRKVTIQSCEFEDSPKTMFEAIGSRMRFLNVERNKFQVFPEFGRLGILDTLEIGNNDLTHMTRTTFAELLRLRTLRMNNGSLTHFPTLALKSLNKTLLTLDLSHNLFTDIAAILLPGSHLKKLDLSYNLIASVRIPSFWNMSALVELKLNNNKITELVTWNSMATLKVLDLRGNDIRKISNNFFKSVEAVEMLDVSSNSIVEIPDVSMMKSLANINLDNNNIHSLGEGLFDKNSKLKTVSCRNNRISHISKDTFSTVSGIKLLFLNNNTINVIEKGAFAKLHEVVEVGLSNNKHIEIANVTDPDMKRLVTLDLSSNRLETLKRNDFAADHGLVSLEYVDVRNTGLESIEKGAFHNKTSTILIGGK